MEKVVYILGAGFSAPFGLPLMGNFIEKAKDMYQIDSEKYQYFNEVFQTIRDLYITTKFYQTNFDNIEEILSILEMKRNIHKKYDAKEKQQFVKFIVDVIDYYTPKISSYSLNTNDLLLKLSLNWFQSIYGYLPKDEYLLRPRYNLDLFIDFTLSLFHLYYTYEEIIPSDFTLRIDEKMNIKLEPKSEQAGIKYSIITLNYDTVLEQICDLINKTFKMNLCFVKKLRNANLETNEIYLAKLHGCMSIGNIIPPIYNKNITNDIKDAWEIAHSVLSEANHIRILGYSLPETDAYIKYLLRLASSVSYNLKYIDALCLDYSEERKVKINFSNFFTHNKRLKFKNNSVQTYFNCMFRENLDIYKGDGKSVSFDIERKHREFFSRYSSDIDNDKNEEK